MSGAFIIFARAKLTRTDGSSTHVKSINVRKSLAFSERKGSLSRFANMLAGDNHARAELPAVLNLGERCECRHTHRHRNAESVREGVGALSEVEGRQARMGSQRSNAQSSVVRERECVVARACSCDTPRCSLWG